MEAERLKKESLAMIRLLKQKEQEQDELRVQNEILAREALVNGYDPQGVEPPAPKKGRRAGQKNKATEYHIGQLKAKLAKYRTQLLEPATKGGKS